MIFVALLGWACFYFHLGFAEPLQRLSYDLPFLRREYLATPGIRLVVMDEKSASTLKQPVNTPWDRRLHAKLVDILTKAGAKAVLFDLIFDAPSSDPGVDQVFAKAIQDNGHVFLGAAVGPSSDYGAVVDQVIPPIAVLRHASAGWGLLVFQPLDPDSGVRQIYPGNEFTLSTTWLMAKKLGANLPDTPDPKVERWINYYGPPDLIESVTYDKALSPQDLAPDYFKDQIVIVGGRQNVTNLEQQKDLYFTPYSHWGWWPFSPGMELHGIILLNLLHHEWLDRMGFVTESAVIIFYGAIMVVLLTYFCGICLIRTACVALAGMVLVTVAGCWLALSQHVWFNWFVPAAVQTPAALVWSLAANYLIETRRRVAIRRAFSLYLSPHMADEIANARFDLKPGGKLVEATLLFTDLKGFTSLSEQIQDPLQISEVMISYFNNTTRHVLDNRGTIIKYMGDAVYASWGAPLSDDDHAFRAVTAAWGMHQSSQLKVHGHTLVTRIGVNTGIVVAGNLGSDFRFDYTLIGDPVNLASRLESLNKYLGTSVLVGDATWQKLNGRFAGRVLGRFVLMGKSEPLTLHELLGPSVSNAIKSRMDIFAEALAAFQAGDLAKARKAFEAALKKYDGEDGPSTFYLKEIARLEKDGRPEEWTGCIILDQK